MEAITLPTDDPWGRITQGHLRLICHIRKGHDRLAFENQFRYAIECERFDDGYDVSGARAIGESWFCVLMYRNFRKVEYNPTILVSNDSSTSTWKHGYIMGLILEAVEDAPQTYRRVGMFSHPWGKGTPNYIMEKCPEFVDVEDPTQLEQKEVTII
jgi:hypothetical protein